MSSRYRESPLSRLFKQRSPSSTVRSIEEQSRIMGEAALKQLEEMLKTSGRRLLEQLYGAEWEKHLPEIIMPLSYVTFFPQEDYLLPILGELIKNIPVDLTIEGEAPAYTVENKVYLNIRYLPASLPGYEKELNRACEYIHELYNAWRRSILSGELEKNESVRQLEEFASKYNLKLPIFSRVRHEYLASPFTYSVKISPFLIYTYYPTLANVLHEAYHWFARHLEALNFLSRRLQHMYSWVPPDLLYKLVTDIGNNVADAYINYEIANLYSNLAQLIESGNIPSIVEQHENFIRSSLIHELLTGIELYDIANVLRTLREFYSAINSPEKLEELFNTYAARLKIPAKMLKNLDIYGRIFLLGTLLALHPELLRETWNPAEILEQSRTPFCQSLLERNVESVTSEIIHILIEFLKRSRNKQQIINNLRRGGQQQQQSQAHQAGQRGSGSGRGQKMAGRGAGREGEEGEEGRGGRRGGKQSEKESESGEESGREGEERKGTGRGGRREKVRTGGGRSGEGEEETAPSSVESAVGERAGSLSPSEAERMLEELGKLIDELYSRADLFQRAPSRAASLYSPTGGSEVRESVLKYFEQLVQEAERRAQNATAVKGTERPPGLAPLGAWRGEIETAKRRCRNLVNILKNILTTHFAKIAVESTYAKKGLVKGVPGDKYRQVPLWILIDASGSITPLELKEFASILSELYRSLVQYNPIFRIAFWDVEMYGPHTVRNRRQLRELFRRSVYGGGGTLIYKPLSHALKEISKTPLRGGLIVLTDSFIGDIESRHVGELLDKLELYKMPKIWLTVTEVVPRSIRERGWYWYLYQPKYEEALA